MRRFFKSFLVILNILAALGFIAGCYNSWFNPLSFWFIGFLTLASFYVFLTLAGFIVFWLFTKKSFAWISIIAIAVCWFPLGHLFRLRKDTTFTMLKNPANLRVMTWNVEHFEILKHAKQPEKKDEMLALINSYAPDVACFQEMVGSDAFPEAINYVPDIAKKLGMPYYYYSYNAKLNFDHHHHFGIIIFSKYPFASQHTLSYSPNDYNSIFQYADVIANSDTFRIFNLHLQSLKFTQSNLDYLNEPTIDEGKDIKESMNLVKKFKRGFLERNQQADHVKKAVNESPYPSIVCGDFNDVPNSYAYTTIGKGLKNVFREKGSGLGRTFSGIAPTLRIDNIFADKRFTIEQYTRVKKKMSDHFPVITDVFFNKTGN